MNSPKRMVKKLLKNFCLIVFLLLLLYPIEWLTKQHGDRNKETMTRLQALDPQQVTIFRIYPRVIKPVDTPVSFRVSDPLIEEFFSGIRESSNYRPDHDTVKSHDHSWYVEVAAENEVFQIQFHIPARKNHIVAGRPLGRGWFQSQKLLQWYKKYSHRWLEPEGAQPTPTPQP